MTLCALCGRDVLNHTETEGLIHLKKLSKIVNEWYLVDLKKEEELR